MLTFIEGIDSQQRIHEQVAEREAKDTNKPLIKEERLRFPTPRRKL
jgi:hypothetical protein